MSAIHLSRRVFLAALGALGIGSALPGCGGGSSTTTTASTGTTVQMYRRSVRGMRASNAAKAHAANKRYATAAAAAADPAHPGDKARVVPLDTTAALFDQYFGTGATVIDLRNV